MGISGLVSIMPGCVWMPFFANETIEQILLKMGAKCMLLKFTLCICTETLY